MCHWLCFRLRQLVFLSNVSFSSDGAVGFVLIVDAAGVLPNPPPPPQEGLAPPVSALTSHSATGQWLTRPPTGWDNDNFGQIFIVSMRHVSKFMLCLLSLVFKQNVGPGNIRNAFSQSSVLACSQHTMWLLAQKQFRMENYIHIMFRIITGVKPLLAWGSSPTWFCAITFPEGLSVTFVVNFLLVDLGVLFWHVHV